MVSHYFQKAEEIVRASAPDKEYLPSLVFLHSQKNAALLAYGPNSQPLNDRAVRHCYDL